MHPTHFISNPRQVHMEGNKKWRLFSEECSSSESQKAGWSQLGVSSEMMERRPWRFIWGINIPPKRSFSMLKVCCILASWLFLWVPFHCSWGYSWKKKCSLFLTKIVRLATVVFWISTFSSTVSCKISLLPHQYPNFVFKLLNFTSTTNCPNLCEASNTQTLWNNLYLDKPTNNHSFLPSFGQTLFSDFLGYERKSTTKLISPLWGRDADFSLLWVVFKFLEFFDVSVSFPFLLGVAEFWMNKISNEFCRFVYGFCIFVRIIREFLCIPFNFVGLSSYLWRGSN